MAGFQRASLYQGVKQGSVLSPTLFLIVMNPLLKSLESSGMGLSVNSYYAGGFLHADDVRTLASSVDTLNNQVELVKSFACDNLLKLNVQKCEIVSFSRTRTVVPSIVCEVDGQVLPSSSTGKCLGYWWSGDLGAGRAVEENITKARRAFFQLGSLGVFHGDLSPLSTRSVIKTCVLSVLLYGSENWVLSDSLYLKLDKFLGELAKRALKWPKYLSNTAARVALDICSVRAYIWMQIELSVETGAGWS